MRKSKVVVLTLVVALFLVVAPNVFGKVCAPRMPVTCSADGLSSSSVTSTVPTPAPKPATKALKSTSPAKTQLAMICIPKGGIVRCKTADTLVSSAAGVEPITKGLTSASPEATQQAMICIPKGGIVRCKAAETLVSSALPPAAMEPITKALTSPEPTQQAMICIPKGGIVRCKTAATLVG